MQANALFRQFATGTNLNNADAGDAAKTNAEGVQSARRRMEDRFRQDFAERARNDDSAQPYGRHATAVSANWRKQ
jgi:hypothetical protein